MLLPALLDHGMQIPHYCYHPKLSIDGSCRMCLVKVEGLPKLTISCNTPVRDGMVVDTIGPEVTQGAPGRPRAAPREPPARLPDLRPGR